MLYRIEYKMPNAEEGYGHLILEGNCVADIFYQVEDKIKQFGASMEMIVPQEFYADCMNEKEATK